MENLVRMNTIVGVLFDHDVCISTIQTTQIMVGEELLYATVGVIPLKPSSLIWGIDLLLNTLLNESTTLATTSLIIAGGPHDKGGNRCTNTELK